MNPLDVASSLFARILAFARRGARRRCLPHVSMAPQSMARRGRKLFLHGRIVHID